ncbi:hypothetical protein ANCDUO_19881 [Ancylostoma duodenale]|uniref:Uncharacterized protein n=1 Tax=Ancylostoma duodenale TaxID=51022 RepID=A0A0C2FTN5_9BILA|nr:hypothetical protein ANCDUO_19881 [Ancylostoma duodenale]
MPEVVQNGKVPPAPPPPPPPEKPRRADGRRRAMKKVDELHPAVEPATGMKLDSRFSNKQPSLLNYNTATYAQ